MAEAADAPSVRYQTVRRLAVGGMGEIFLARERGRLGFSRLVVIKRMLPELARRRDFVDMFVDEARIVGHLSHPNICQILELGEEDGVPFLALEYVRGDSLSGIWDRAHSTGSSVPRAVTLRILADTAWALHYAHEACDADGKPLNVIHRDISPHNVMVSFFGDVKLMDFGIARADNRMHRTDTGKVKGKISYMAPEQLRGQPLDRRADVFAVGVMLWELTLSRRLFGGGSEVETLQKAIACEVPRPRTIDPTYPEELEAIVMRALAADRDARTATAGELAQALRSQLAMMGGAERVDLAALMSRLYPTESAASDDVIPTLSWIQPVDTETHEKTPSSENLAPRPTVPLKTPTPPDDLPRPTVPLKTPTPPGDIPRPTVSRANDAGALVPRSTAPMRTPDAAASARPAGTGDADPRPTLPLRTPDAGASARPAGASDDDPRPTLSLRTPDANSDGRITLPQRATGAADDARPTLPQRAMGDAATTGAAYDARPTLPQRSMAATTAAPRRRRWLGVAAAVVVVAGVAIAAVLATHDPDHGGVAPGSVAIDNGPTAATDTPTGTTPTATTPTATTPTGTLPTNTATTGTLPTANTATTNTATTGTTPTNTATTNTATTGTTPTNTATTGTTPTNTATTNTATTDGADDVATGRGHGAGTAHHRHGGGAQPSSASTDLDKTHGPGRSGAATSTTTTVAGTSGGASSTTGAGTSGGASSRTGAGTSGGASSTTGGGTSGGTTSTAHGGGAATSAPTAGGGTSGGTTSTARGGGATSPSTNGTAATTTASKATGTLAVASDQTGVVSIDGVRAKSTPYQTELAAGDHRVEIELVEGAGTLRASARVVAGSKTKCRAEKGALACAVSPR